MSPEIIEKWEDVSLPFGISGPQQLIANEILQTGVSQEHIAEIKPRIVEDNLNLLIALDSDLRLDDEELRVVDVNQKIAPTDIRTPIITYTGQNPEFYNDCVLAGVHGVPGFGYRNTDEKITNLTVRFVVPNNKRNINRLARTIKRAA